jgi:ATP-dependent helicase/nuclease subunit A
MNQAQTAARDRAQHEQLLASDPAVSAFVAASAGSGKTKLLTDRLLRLMLTGADPARIQCLTFTKAAAAEMALRLQRTLGQWVTLDDDALASRLRALHVTPDAERLAQARALFARVLDLPGGMRIGTIHAFCQSLLRRFPLEAQLSPHFSLVDDIDAEAALREAREDMLAEPHTPARRADLASLAGLASADRFGQLVADLAVDRDRLDAALALGEAGLAAAQARALGAIATDADLLRAAIRWPAEADFAACVGVIQREGSPSVVGTAAELLAWLSLDDDERAENWAEYRGKFLRPDGEPRGLGRLINPKLAKSQDFLLAACAAEQQRVLTVEDQRRALLVAAASAALARLAAPVRRFYAQRKDAAAWLDYDDLIGRTSRLLVDPGAAWVLYKLDGGLDHLLLDEVQDTAPAQWAIAGALTQEFFAGEGAAAAHRTMFAVGDRKQSIYSFQGADPAGFEHWRGLLRDRAAQAGAIWRDVELDVSFRSTTAVLALTDAVFASPDAAAGVTEPGRLHHIADRAGHAGRVELWPLTPRPDQADADAWTVPRENLGQVSAPQRLADALAGWIARRCGTEDLPSQGRKLAAGDILVLVRRRNQFARALVRALKQRGVPAAGLDRMILTEQPAVADLLALCDVLLLPQDDLQLACVLTSPLGGLDDASLLALAAGRPGTLWQALRRGAADRPEWAAAHDFLATLLARVDYASPYALLAEALGPLGGRARLLARLGPDATEPIDELLGAALTYAATHPPSLQGFVQWLRQSAAEVKRQAEGAGAAVRVMTVHGAKGLQAPLVILPDTTSLPPDDGPLLWAADPLTGVEVPLWSPRRELRCATIDALRATARTRAAEEYNRLLYVALTRAEDRLVICGPATAKTPPDSCWYELVRRGLQTLTPDTRPFDVVADPWDGELLIHETPQTIAPVTTVPGADHAPAADLPAWAGAAPIWQPSPPPLEPALPSPLAPSRPEGANLGETPRANSPLAERDPAGTRFKTGQLVHALLQHLPALPPDTRAAAARRYLDRPGHDLSPAAIDRLVSQVLAVLDLPDLAPLFGPAGRAEVPLSGVIAGNIVGGLVDRLAVLPDRVLLADYKTNRDPPQAPDDVPVLYLRQMAAYRAVLQAIFPGRLVHCALVWTTGAAVMALPESLLDRHAPSASPAA